MPSGGPAREPNEASEGISEVGIVCLCLSVFGKSASVTGPSCGTFQRMTRPGASPLASCSGSRGCLGFFRVSEGEAAPCKPYLLMPSSTSLFLALLRMPRSSPAVGKRLAGTSTVVMRLETAEYCKRHAASVSGVNVRLRSVLSSPMRLPQSLFDLDIHANPLIAC